MDNEKLNIVDERFEGYTNVIACKVAYLIGVPENLIVGRENLGAFTQNKNAQICRLLCQVRTRLVRYFVPIITANPNQDISLLQAEKWISFQNIAALDASGVYSTSKRLNLKEHIMNINKEIKSRVSALEHEFPDWVKWDYILDLFVMPCGKNYEYGADIGKEFIANINCYPYGLYINWKSEDCGNILTCDVKFLKVIYKQHGDEFVEDSKVKPAPSKSREYLDEFITEADNIVIAVDCENSNPYYMFSMLKYLERIDKIQYISKIILFNDIYANGAWHFLESRTSVKVEEVLAERVLSKKSIVDATMIANICKEHYQNGVNKVIVAASDSDYFGLFRAIPTALFLVMVEKDLCSEYTIKALEQTQIPYLMTDDFFDSEGDAMRRQVIIKAFKDEVRKQLDINMNQVFSQVCKDNSPRLSKEVCDAIYDECIKKLSFEVEEDGTLVLE